MRQMRRVVRQYRFARTTVQVVNPLPKPTQFIFVKTSLPPPPPPNRVLEVVGSWDLVIKYSLQILFYGTALYKWQSSAVEIRDYSANHFEQMEKLIRVMASGDKDGKPSDGTPDEEASDGAPDEKAPDEKSEPDEKAADGKSKPDEEASDGTPDEKDGKSKFSNEQTKQ